MNQLFDNPSAIERKEYPLVFVTPMAMHGADPKGEAIFRAASLKGIYRYWWRTLQLEPDPKKLLEEEVRLFGGTETANKRKSPISFSIEQPVRGMASVNVLPHKTAKFRPRSIEAGRTAILRIQVKKQNEVSLSKYEAYLKYMFHLSGMGQRARRGFGSCQLSTSEWNNQKDFVRSLKAVLEELHVADQFAWKEEGNCILKRIKPSPALHPVLSAVYIGKEERTFQEVLNQIGYASHVGNPKGCLGSATPRWASPLWCTVRRIGNAYYPVISEMQVANRKITARYKQDRQTFLQVLGVK